MSNGQSLEHIVKGKLNLSDITLPMFTEIRDELIQFEIDRKEGRLIPQIKPGYVHPSKRESATAADYGSMIRTYLDYNDVQEYGTHQGNDPDGLANKDNPHHDPQYMIKWYLGRD